MRVLMASQFFPRGGSAHVAANLARALPAGGCEVRVVSGSVADDGDANAFFAGLDVVAVDMTPALETSDPLMAAVPFHPSYEDRPGAPDRVFASLPDNVYEHQVAAWCDILADAGAAEADVLHLHHLTPVHAAAERVAPDVPVVGHLHGTELLMLEEGDRWPHAAAWRERMRAWAGRCARLIVLTDGHVDRAVELLGVDAGRCVVVPNGFDPESFFPRDVDRAAFWRERLVEQPRGWAPGEPPGSAGYEEADFDGPVLLSVSRFTAVKRIGVMIEAYALARERFATRAPLVLVGGHPGEWEGEHPLETIRRTGAQDVFLAGWYGHDALPEFFSAADVLVLASVREQFGQVLVEGMACRIPPIAVDAHGPAGIVEDGRTGWLVPGDDVAALAEAMVAAVNDPDERLARGRAACVDARRRYAWPALAMRVADVYEAAVRVAQHAR
ncbi:MAG: glycosyltransferase family 4 protein [Solirubrobacteraceae bacterium]